jgi:hypothetical protein
MEQAGDLGKPFADPRAGLEEVGVRNREVTQPDSAQLPRSRVPTEVHERQLRVGGGQIDVRVELDQFAHVNRARFGGRSGDVRATGLADHVADQRLVGDGGEESGVHEHSDRRHVGDPRVDRVALRLDAPDERTGGARGSREQPELGDRVLDLVDRIAGRGVDLGAGDQCGVGEVAQVCVPRRHDQVRMRAA